MNIDSIQKGTAAFPFLSSILPICGTKVDIVVQSKTQAVFDAFLKGFQETTAAFPFLTLHVIHKHLAVPKEIHSVSSDEYGAKIINPILRDSLKSGTEAFGVLNDDLWFSAGWLEDTLALLKEAECASAGYVETTDFPTFKNAVEKTKNEVGGVEYLYGGEYLFRASVFAEIGLFDERFDWSCDDLDWAWRIRLNGMRSATSKRITVAHLRAQSMKKNSKARNSTLKMNQQRFYDKHGYRSYRTLRGEYQHHHSYFRQFA